MSAQMWSGFSQGASNLARSLADEPTRRAREQEALARAQTATAQAQEFADNAPMRQRESELKMQAMESQIAQMQRADLKNNTMTAAKQYLAKGDTQVWNEFLARNKTNPSAQKIFGNTSSVGPLAKSPETDQALRNLGFMDPSAVYDDPQLSKNFITVETNEGPVVMPVDSFLAGSGAMEGLDEEALTKLERNARVQQMLRSGNSKQKVDLKEQVFAELVGQGMSKADAYRAIQTMEATGKGTNVLSTQEERAVQQIMEDKNVDFITATGMYYAAKNPARAVTSADERMIQQIAEEQGVGLTEAAEIFYKMSRGSRMSNQERAIETLRADPANADKSDSEILDMASNLSRTSQSKNLQTVDKVKTDLDAQNFFEMDVASMTPQDRADVHRNIQKIEHSLGIKRSTEERRTLRNLRSLVNLGGTVGTRMKSNQVGFADNFFGNIKKYVVDDATGREAKSAYETFRNVFRNELFGATVTDGENRNFIAAAGSANQQLKPLLAAFRTQMGTVKSQLETISQLDDPYLAHYYFGGDLEQVDQAIDNISRRLGQLDSKGTVPQQEQTIVIPPRQDSTTPPTFDFKAALEANRTK